MKKSLEYFIRRCNSFILERFGFIPKETKLVIMPTPTGDRGCFIPSEMKAIVDYKGIHDLPILIHEYFGHGLHCEFSYKGYALRSDPKKVKNLDNILSESDAFAVWLEWLTLDNLNLSKLWKKREAALSKYEFDLLKQAKEFVDSFGELSFLYFLGFPIIKSRSNLIKMIAKYIKFNEIHFVIAYGSRDLFSDADFLVCSENVHQERIFTYGTDILFTTPKKLEEQIKLLDVEYIEPLLTGFFLLGDEKMYKRLRSMFRLADFRKAQEHLYAKTISYLKTCKQFLDQFSSTGKSFFAYCFLTNLSFAVSSYFASQHYKKSNKIITFDELCEKVQLLKNIRNKIKCFKRRCEIDVDELKSLLVEFLNLIKK